MKEVLEKLIKLTSATPKQKSEIAQLYKQLINPNFNFCSNCPASVRQAHNGLKIYYKENYGK